MSRLPSLIAVVDDDPGMRKGISSLVRSEGYESATFTSARDFLADAAVERADCLISDLQMPGMDGFELQREMSRKRPKLPVILMTAFGDESTRKSAIARGFRAILIKPFESAILLEEIRLALGANKS